LNAFEGVVAIHGEEHAEYKLGLSSELVSAAWTCVTKPPSMIVALQSGLDALIEAVANGEVDIKTD
jgi:hypothetical protein